MQAYPFDFKTFFACHEGESTGDPISLSAEHTWRWRGRHQVLSLRMPRPRSCSCRGWPEASVRPAAALRQDCPAAHYGQLNHLRQGVWRQLHRQMLRPPVIFFQRMLKNVKMEAVENRKKKNNFFLNDSSQQQQQKQGNSSIFLTFHEKFCHWRPHALGHSPKTAHAWLTGMADGRRISTRWGNTMRGVIRNK